MSTIGARITIAAISENHNQKDLDALFPGAEKQWTRSIPEQADPNIAAYIDLDFVPEPARIQKLAGLLPALVFVNAVTPTLGEIGQPFIRINAWPGFAMRKIHELVLPASGFEAEPGGTTVATAERIKTLYQNINCDYLAAPDIPGMISARVVAGIINEAWYTWEEKVSTKEEIDTAMRLGTNYPLGPFQWGERIGLGQIVGLLRSLNKTDPRYEPAKSLVEAIEIC